MKIIYFLISSGTLQPHKWENAMTIDKASWGYRRDAKLSDYMTQKELLKQLIQTISCGGNILVNKFLKKILLI